MIYGEGSFGIAHQVGYFECPRCKTIHFNLIFDPVEEGATYEFEIGVKVVGHVLVQVSGYTHYVLCPVNHKPVFLNWDGQIARLG